MNQTANDLFGRVSKADTGQRSAFDFYETPSWMTRSLLHHHADIQGRTVLEPCAGDDAISRVLRAAGCTVVTNDIDPRHPSQMHRDAARSDFWLTLAPVEYVVTNVPFDKAFPILAHAVPWALVGVAFLLRKTFLEPTEDRGPWLAAHPPARQIGQPRYSFRGKGSDTVSCDWCVWLKHPKRPVHLPPIVIDAEAEHR